MNQEKIIKELMEKYPGKNIKKNDIEDPTEILCEVNATIDHPKYSMAISVIDKTYPHFHKERTEEISVIKGNLILHVDTKTFTLHEKETCIIPPNQIHWAEGEETWVSIFFQPGWTKEDSFLVKKT